MRMQLDEIEIIEDRTAASTCDEGFLRLKRLQLRNRYRDGSLSAVYPCDVVSRPGSDAVVAVLYERGAAGRPAVLLRESPRAPIYLRRFEEFEHPDPRVYRSLLEVVAGIVEAGDGSGPEGLRYRAAIEAREEAGVECLRGSIQEIGDGSFASPGTSDEKVYYCAAEIAPGERCPPTGDGSVMEECAELVTRELREAIAACRTGEIPDMKTEIGLLRLADHLGYIPQLDCFVADLPEELAQRYSALGIVGVAK